MIGVGTVSLGPKDPKMSKGTFLGSIIGITFWALNLNLKILGKLKILLDGRYYGDVISCIQEFTRNSILTGQNDIAVCMSLCCRVLCKLRSVPLINKMKMLFKASNAMEKSYRLIYSVTYLM